MADPTVYEFCALTATEELATGFACRHGLLLSDQRIQNYHQLMQMKKQCLLGTDECQGTVHAAKKKTRGKEYDGFRCTQCRKFRSVKNAIIDGELRGASKENDLRSFFATVGSDSKSHTKISLKSALAVIYFWSKNLSMRQTKYLLTEDITQDHTFVDWRHYLREVCQRELNDAAPMAGPGENVQIDETLLRGKRKYNRGRILLGNRVPPARKNYGKKVVGPWVFGMIWKQRDGTQELRMFHVLRRDEATLRALIQRNVAPGTTITSDKWRAYRNISQWPGYNYNHETVNHSENFVDPDTGANTQRIETHWGHVKTLILRQMRGTTTTLLPGHLAEYWWVKTHTHTPLNDILEAIARQFPLL